MNDYRGELRVFGLIMVSLLASVMLYGGLNSADVDAKILGVSFSVAGPAAIFIALVVVFSWRGLLTFSVERSVEEIVNRPIDRWTASQAERAIDDLQSEINELSRRQQEVRAYVVQLSQGVDPAAALGMRPATRGVG